MQFHQARNSSKETVVLLHSLGTDRTLWANQVPVLEDRYRVLTPESRGHGGRQNEGEINLDTWVADLHALIAPLKQPVHLVGLSMGGIQAIAYATRYPNAVRSLVLANTFAAIDTEMAEAKIQSIRKSIHAAGMDRYAAQYLSETLTAALPAIDRARLHAAISGVASDDYIQSSECTFRVDLTSRLQDIAAPTMIIIGDRDRKTPLPLSETLVEHISGARLAIVPEAGHLSNIDSPNKFNEVLLGFLSEVCSKGVPA